MEKHNKNVTRREKRCKYYNKHRDKLLAKQAKSCAKREQKDKEIEPITIEEPKKISHNTIDDNIETII